MKVLFKVSGSTYDAVMNHVFFDGSSVKVIGDVVVRNSQVYYIACDESDFDSFVVNRFVDWSFYNRQEIIDFLKQEGALYVISDEDYEKLDGATLFLDVVRNRIIVDVLFEDDGVLLKTTPHTIDDVFDYHAEVLSSSEYYFVNN